jgi:hypothetical protein
VVLATGEPSRLDAIKSKFAKARAAKGGAGTRNDWSLVRELGVEGIDTIGGEAGEGKGQRSFCWVILEGCETRALLATKYRRLLLLHMTLCIQFLCRQTKPSSTAKTACPKAQID